LMIYWLLSVVSIVWLCLPWSCFYHYAFSVVIISLCSKTTWRSY
jgi:hypothetical protein